MSASEIVGTSTVVGANDDAPADLCVADGVNVAVIAGRTVSVGGRGEPAGPMARGVTGSDAAVSQFLRGMRLASKCHHGLQDVGCADQRFAACRALRDTFE
jgi:hypothetical protein